MARAVWALIAFAVGLALVALLVLALQLADDGEGLGTPLGLGTLATCLGEHAPCGLV
jgi:hypothetical protein